MKEQFGVGYIRHRETGISDYTVVGHAEVGKLLKLLQPYVKLKSPQVALGLEILEKLEAPSLEGFLEACKLVDEFGELNYSKKRTITCEVVEEELRKRVALPP